MNNGGYTLKIGLFGIGLESYWEQFPGLKKNLESYINIVSTRISEFGEEMINLGLIDTHQKAIDAGHRFRQADVDIIFLYVTTLISLNIQTLLGDVYGINFDSSWCTFRGYLLTIAICGLFHAFAIQVIIKTNVYYDLQGPKNLETILLVDNIKMINTL